MKTASSTNAAAVASIIRKALSQDENTPAEDRLSMRVLLVEALPLLEQLAAREEAAS